MLKLWNKQTQLDAHVGSWIKRSMWKQATLQVSEAYSNDIPDHLGIVRIDYSLMDKLGISVGDNIGIKGIRFSVGKVYPLYPLDEGKNIIRIDGLLRNNLIVSLNDMIELEPISFSNAEQVILRPVEPIPSTVDSQYIMDSLENRPLIIGDLVSIRYFGGLLTFYVFGTNPVGAVIVTQNTTFEMAYWRFSCYGL